MAANTLAIFPRIGKIAWALIAAANAALTGAGTVGTDIFLIFTADATNGSRVDNIKVKHVGTNVATVLRIFINNGATNATTANNTLVLEKTIAANTLSQTAESTEQDIAVDYVLPAGYKLYATIGTAVAAGLNVTAFGGDY